MISNNPAQNNTNKDANSTSALQFVTGHLLCQRERILEIPGLYDMEIEGERKKKTSTAVLDAPGACLKQSRSDFSTTDLPLCTWATVTHLSADEAAHLSSSPAPSPSRWRGFGSRSCGSANEVNSSVAPETPPPDCARPTPGIDPC